MTFHNLCEKEAKAAGMPYDVPTDPKEQSDFFIKQTPDLLIQALAKTGRKVDAIIVDEGQDFEDDWWIALDEILQPEGELCIFLDNNQNLFRREAQIPVENAPFELTYNCRNTMEINSWLMQHCDYNVKSKSIAPQGTPPKVHFWKTEVNQNVAVKSTINKLLDEGFTKEEIIILTPYRPDRSEVSKLLKETPAFKGIEMHSIMSFKGLESNALLLCDIGSNTFTKRKDLIYTAASRAKMRLYVFSDFKFKSFFG